MSIITNNVYINRLILILCTLLIFSGQITLNRFIPINGHIGELKVNFFIIFLLIIILIYTRNYISNNLYIKKLLIKIFIATSLILFFNILIDLIEKRKINIDFNLDIFFIAVISAFLCAYIKNKNDFLFLMRSLAITSIFLASTNFILWEYDRVIILSQLTLNRVILFGLGAATLLFIEKLKLENLLLISVLCFLASFSSLKIGILALVLFIFLSITGLIAYEKYKTATSFFFAVILGLYIGYVNNNFIYLKSRLDVASEKKLSIPDIKPDNFIAPKQLDAIEKYLTA